MLLGIKKGHNPVPPTTVYLMLGRRCISNCAYCSQARSYSRRGNYLSRVLWPPVEAGILMDALKNGGGYHRVCIQTLDYPEMLEDLKKLVWMLRKILKDNIGISASVTPLNHHELAELRDSGLETASIALDAANEEVFDRVRGKIRGNRFTWHGSLKSLQAAREIFPWVYTHIIVGLGESDKDIVSLMRMLKSQDIGTALFSYTPIKHATIEGLKPPDIIRYHTIQLVRHLIYMDIDVCDIDYDKHGFIKSIGVPYETFKRHIDDWNLARAFMTSGCPHCNRPYYNDSPQGPIYNYAYIPEHHITLDILDQMKERGVIQ